MTKVDYRLVSTHDLSQANARERKCFFDVGGRGRFAATPAHTQNENSLPERQETFWHYHHRVEDCQAKSKIRAEGERN